MLGVTSKVAGTEDGIKEPQPTFSSCFGEPFLVHHPFKYGDLLVEKIKETGANVWLINTGWVKGGYGEGNRIDIKYTRSMIDYIHNGDYMDDKFDNYSIFNLEVPQNVNKKINVPKEYLKPKCSWKDRDKYDEDIKKLYDLFEETYKNKF